MKTPIHWLTENDEAYCAASDGRMFTMESSRVTCEDCLEEMREYDPDPVKRSLRAARKLREVLTDSDMKVLDDARMGSLR